MAFILQVKKDLKYDKYFRKMKERKIDSYKNTYWEICNQFKLFEPDNVNFSVLSISKSLTFISTIALMREKYSPYNFEDKYYQMLSKEKDNNFDITYIDNPKKVNLIFTEENKCINKSKNLIIKVKELDKKVIKELMKHYHVFIYVPETGLSIDKYLVCSKNKFDIKENIFVIEPKQKDINELSKKYDWYVDVSYSGIKLIKRMKVFELYGSKCKIGYKKSSYVYVKFNKLKRRLNVYKRLLDPLDQKKLRYVLRKMDIYNPLKNILREKHGIKHATNAWLKMYEIASKFDIIRDKKKINSFHICEMPGGFILGIDHYIKKKLPKSEFNWKSQSLNPYNDHGMDRLDDQFKLVKEYKNRWFFGKDNTGNIMNPENIKWYKDNIKNIDFVTGDCGIHIEGRGYAEQEIYESKLMFSQVLMMLHVLPKNKNFVIKTFLPFTESSTISWIYLLSCLFETTFLTKPLTSRSVNSEVYIIGYKFKGITDKELKYLRDILKDYSHKFGVFGHNEIPQEFLDTLYEASEYFINQQIQSLKEVIYFYNNEEEIATKFLPEKKNMINNWLRMHDLFE